MKWYGSYVKHNSALDESILLKDDALLLIYIYLFHPKWASLSRVTVCPHAENRHKGANNVVNSFWLFQTKEIPLTNVVVRATHGAAAMGRRNRSFTAYLTETVLNVLTIHCVVHRQHLVTKNLTWLLHHSLNIPRIRLKIPCYFPSFQSAIRRENMSRVI